MIVKLTNRERPSETRTIRDVADIDSCMDTDGNLCLWVTTVHGWRGLFPLIDWYAEIQGGYQNEKCD